MLNETLAPMTLGLATKTSLGLHGAQFSNLANDASETESDETEEEVTNEMHGEDDCGCDSHSLKKHHHHSHKKHHHHHNDMDMEDMGDEEEMGMEDMEDEDDMEDMGDEDEMGMEDMEDEDEDEEDMEDMGDEDEEDMEDMGDEEDYDDEEELETEVDVEDDGDEIEMEDSAEMDSDEEDGNNKLKIVGDYMTKESAKTWWESVSGMVGEKGLFKNASEFMSEVTVADPSGQAKLAIGKFKTFIKANEVDHLTSANVKAMIKALCDYILENNDKVPGGTMKMLLKELSDEYMDSKK